MIRCSDKKKRQNRVTSFVQQEHLTELPYHYSFITKNFHHAQKECVLNRNLTLKIKIGLVKINNKSATPVIKIQAPNDYEQVL